MIGAICNGIKLLRELGNGGRRGRTPHFHEFQQCYYQKEKFQHLTLIDEKTGQNWKDEIFIKYDIFIDEHM